MADRPRTRHVAHPTPITYLKVAITLAALTAIEVAIFYIDALEPAFLPLFLILSIVKFCLVVLFYMHLKFDSRLFSGVFVGGLLLAVAVAVVVMSLFQVLSATASPPEGPELVTGPGGAVGLPGTPVPTPTPIRTEPTPGPVGVEPTSKPVGTGVTPKVAPTVVPGEGDLVALGKEIFLNAPANAGAQPLWCSTCHLIEGVTAGLIGPDLTHIGTNAATRKPGMSAEKYIRESIRAPQIFVAQGVERSTVGLMTTAIVQGLTDEQVEALVAFLLTHK